MSTIIHIISSQGKVISLYWCFTYIVKVCNACNSQTPTRCEMSCDAIIATVDGVIFNCHSRCDVDMAKTSDGIILLCPRHHTAVVTTEVVQQKTVPKANKWKYYRQKNLHKEVENKVSLLHSKNHSV